MLAGFEMRDVTADGGNRADDFVPGDEGEIGPAKFVLDHGQVGMANAAMGDLNFHLVVGQGAEIVFHQFQLRAFGGSGVSFSFCAHREFCAAL